MIQSLSLWLKNVWPDRMLATELLRQYSRLAELKLVLADIALRGGVWTTSHVQGDSHASAYAEGRRAMALEIIKLTSKDLEDLLTSLPAIKKA